MGATTSNKYLPDKEFGKFVLLSNDLFAVTESIWTNTAKDGSGTDLQPLVDSDGHLQVDVLSGGGGGTQYTEGDVSASIIGTAALGEAPGNTLEVLQLDANNYLKVIQQGAVTETNSGDILTSLQTLDDIVQIEDAAHSSGDKGVMLLGVRQDNASSLVDTDGDYTPVSLSDHGCVNVDPQHYLNLDDCDATTGWTVINNDTDNLATATNHVWKTASLSFDKVDGAGNTVFAGIQKTITEVSMNKFMEEGGGFFLGSVYVSSIADMDYAWFRFGTDSSNYNEWRVDAEELAEGQWNGLRGAMTSPFTSTGNGWNSSAVTYIAIGVAMDVQNDTLAGILVDALFANSGLQTSADITTAVATSVASPNVNVVKWGPKTVARDAGNSTTGTLRVVNATDDVNLSAIKTAVEIIDNAIVGTEMQVDVITVPAPLNVVGGGTEAAALRVTMANDSTGTLTVDTTGTSGLEVVQDTAADLNCTEANSGDILTSVQLIDDTVATISATDLIRVGIFDASDTQITTFGGGTQYTEDAAVPANPVGTAMMMERDDVLGGITPAAGDWTHPFASAEGALWVQDFNSDASLALLETIDADTGTLAGAVVGTEMQVDVVASLPAGTNAIGKLAANTGVDIGDVDVTSITGVTMSNAAMQITGDEAHDAADAGNPVKLGAKASDAMPADVADNDRANLTSTQKGVLKVTRPYGTLQTPIHKTVTTAGTQVPLMASKTIAYNVKMKALSTNSGTIYLGNSAVSSANGVEYLPGEPEFFDHVDLNTVYIDSSVDGEGVSFSYEI